MRIEDLICKTPSTVPGGSGHSVHVNCYVTLSVSFSELKFHEFKRQDIFMWRE